MLHQCQQHHQVVKIAAIDNKCDQHSHSWHEVKNFSSQNFSFDTLQGKSSE